MTTAIHPDLFRSLLRRHAAGVVVVTAAGTRPAGFTATSFTSVSLDPPLVSFCLARTSSSWPVVAGADHVGVHVLTDAHVELARSFATSGVDRFAAPVRWHIGDRGVPILDDAHTVIVCRIAERVAAGDHVIVLAEPVSGASTTGPLTPLVYHDGQYLAAA